MQQESIVFDAFNEFIVVVCNMRAGSAAFHQVARRTFTSRPLAEELMAEASRFAASAYAWDHGSIASLGTRRWCLKGETRAVSRCSASTALPELIRRPLGRRVDRSTGSNGMSRPRGWSGITKMMKYHSMITDFIN